MLFRMSDHKRIWSVVVPIALLILVLGTTLGMVWHHHANTSPETCPLCHLTIAPSVEGVRACVMVPVGTGPEVRYIAYIPGFASSRLPARAPPSA